MKNLPHQSLFSLVTLTGDRALKTERRILHHDRIHSFDITCKHLKDSQLIGGVFMVKDVAWYTKNDRILSDLLLETVEETTQRCI